MLSLKMLLSLFSVLMLSSIANAFDCYTITKCTPEISALDENSLNQTIEIRCTFRDKIANPLDVMWKFSYNNEYRMAIDMDGVTMPPFKHKIMHVEDNYPNQPYSISVLRVPLLNASYYTNYTCVSVMGQCYRTVKINLKQKALGYMNGSPQTFAFSSLSFVPILLCFLAIY